MMAILLLFTLVCAYTRWVTCNEYFYYSSQSVEIVFLFHTQLGDIFTIVAAGKKMTFVMDHRDYHHYFTTTQTDFQAAVQPFTKGAGE